MIAALLDPAVAPFTAALACLAALLCLELVLHLVGGSLMAAGVDAPEADLSGPDAGSLPDTGIDAPGEAAPDATAGGLAGALGLAGAPALVWLAAALAGFGATGHAVQALAVAVLARPLDPALVALPALVAGLWFARGYARTFARLLPRTESAATGPQFLGGLAGVVSQGTARAGMPAEVRLTDRHGNTHYQRCEPLDPADVIAEGTPVTTIRRRAPARPGGWELRIIAAGPPPAGQPRPPQEQ